MKFWTRWQPPLMQSLPPQLRSWLTNTGSLTRQLQQVCDDAFSVKVLQSGWQRPLPDEALLLKQPIVQLCFQREVHLLDGRRPQIYARTLIPVRTYYTMRRRFDALGNQPLGDMLFNEPTLVRGPIQVAQLLPGELLYQLATRHLDSKPDRLWGRRSCFYLGGKGMLVNEIFLPSDKWSDE